MTKKSRPINNLSNIEQQQLSKKCQWLHRLINRRSFKIFILIIICILNIIDLFVDWCFFVLKTTIAKGLVFGPPPANLKLAALIFCIVSTCTSLLEIVQIIRDTYQNRLTSLFSRITNCLTLWLEDVPFLTLNFLIVICHDGEVTYISLAKTTISIIAALIRFLFILLNKWLIRHDYQRKDNLSQFFNILSTLGIIIVFMFSITINIIANLPIDRFGRVYLEKPSDFTRSKFAHQKYFNHVGLFLRSSNENNKYIYLTNIDHIIENNSKKFIYGINRNKNIFCIKEINQTCYIKLNNTNIQIYNQPLSNKLINYSLIFQFKQPDSSYLLGDIRYNIIRCDLKDYNIDNRKFSFHYFRFKRNFNQTRLHLISNENIYRYYDIENDFESVEHTWRTGLSRCTSTSSYSPHRYSNIKIDNCF